MEGISFICHSLIRWSYAYLAQACSAWASPGGSFPIPLSLTSKTSCEGVLSCDGGVGGVKGWRTSSQCKSANESNVRFPLSVRSPLLHAHGTFSPLEEHIMRGPQVDRGSKPCWGLEWPTFITTTLELPLATGARLGPKASAHRARCQTGICDTQHRVSAGWSSILPPRPLARICG